MTIGIPKSLVYFKRPIFWETFFENLGFKVILSPKTNKEIVKIGVANSDSENCFSFKVYFGHLIYLDKKCDLIFVPRLITNEEKLEYCPKFFGLPDLAKILVKTPLLTLTLDERKESFEKSVFKLGKKLKKKKREIEKAFEKALFKEKILKETKKKQFFEKISSQKPKIVLISHPYNFYDDYVNLNIKKRLEKMEVVPIFIEEVFKERPSNSSFPIKLHWEFAKEIIQKIEILFQYQISGVIQISAFACGCDAFLKEIVERKIKEKKIPFLYLIFDEHTGEAGFQTRLEAFLDTLQ